MSAKPIDLQHFADCEGCQAEAAIKLDRMRDMWKEMLNVVPPHVAALFVRSLFHDLSGHNEELWKQSKEMMKVLINNKILKSSCGHHVVSD